MLNHVDEAEAGRVVYLYPHSKTASRACHRLLTVAIVEGRKHWPMVVVKWNEGGAERWELVHRDNIRLRPSVAATRVDKKEGDSKGDVATGTKWKPRLLPNHIKPIDLPDNMEQGELF